MTDRIVLASDHGGFALKNELIEGLRASDYEVIDVGTRTAEAADYADFGHKAAEHVLAGKADRAILVCGTGVGMAIAANRHKGIRAVNCSDVFTARYSRLHNDANVLSLGGRVVGFGLAWEIVQTWLTTKFTPEPRHVRRIAKLDP